MHNNIPPDDNCQNEYASSTFKQSPRSSRVRVQAESAFKQSPRSSRVRVQAESAFKQSPRSSRVRVQAESAFKQSPRSSRVRVQAESAFKQSPRSSRVRVQAESSVRAESGFEQSRRAVGRAERADAGPFIDTQFVGEIASTRQAPRHLVDFDLVVKRWRQYLRCGQAAGERLHRWRFAMDQDYGVLAGDLVLPRKKLVLIGMGREAVNRMDPRTHRNFLPKKLNLPGTVDELSAERPLACISHKQDARFRAPEIVPEMMPDTTSRAHARACHDYGATTDLIDRDGVRSLPRKPQSWNHEWVFSGRE